MEGWSLVAAGVILILVGFALVFLGFLKEAWAPGGGRGRVEGGGVVVIGPIPIIFGTSARAAIIAAVLAVVLMVLAIILVRGVAPH